ncbi:MAG: acyloxyacyl hydrolase [Kiritimatiellae bacterium]|nr:acyloxyacyl hydrolase [Kiritimatiellia bacterium]
MIFRRWMMRWLYGCVFFGTMFSVALPSEAVESDGGAKDRWAGFYVSHGISHRFWSTKNYKGYENNTLGLFEEWETTRWTSSIIPYMASVRGELRYMDLLGTIELLEKQVLPEGRDGGPYLKNLSSLWQIAVLCVPRLVFFPNSSFRPSFHAGIGLSLLNDKVLDDGTRYNFNLLTGCGLEIDFFRQWTMLADIRLEHFSNGGLMYLTNRAVIGMESVSGVIGLRHPF